MGSPSMGPRPAGPPAAAVRWSRPLVGRRLERARLDEFVAAVRSGHSRVLVLRGEAGIGKSALLEHLASQAQGCRVLVGTGVQADTELAFAALHQVLGPLLGRVDRLPPPQRDAMKVAFGLLAAPLPDPFLVALAVLTLLSDAASEQPIICLIDDEQWLDKASVHALALVARRLDAEAVGIVFAGRRSDPLLHKLPELVIEGLDESEARLLLESSFVGPLDPLVRERLLAETHGNPLALLELPRGVSPADIAGGFALPSVMPLADRIEESFRRRLDLLASPTRQLLLLAAAEPTGSPSLFWRAAEGLGIPREALIAALDASLIEIGVRVLFRHPLVRSAVYRSASLSEQREVHGALATVTDSRTDPDRRTWHRALATEGLDEEVARELEHTALRAQARGGLAAAAMFLEWAATLTPDVDVQARRLLAAATAKRDVGDLEAALNLLAVADSGGLSPARAGALKRLRGQIAFDRRELEDGVRLFAEAAELFELLDPQAARQALGEALCLSIWTGDRHGAFGLRFAAAAVAAAPSPTEPVRPVDRVIEAFATRYCDGAEVSAPLFSRAVRAFLDPDPGAELIDQWYWLIQSRVSWMLALETWDAASWRHLAAKQVEVARELGAALHLKHGLNNLVCAAALMGDFAAAEDFAHEARVIAEVTGTPRLQYAEMVLAAYRGDTSAATSAIASVLQEAVQSRVQLHVTCANWALALLNNGLGRHDLAREAGLVALEGIDIAFGPLVVPELAEAASRTGDRALLDRLRDWTREQADVTPTDWARGVAALVRALAADDDAGDPDYREAIQCFDDASQRLDIARAQLLYGEWLRRQRRTTEARTLLREAHRGFVEMGCEAFADRALIELRAAGEPVPRRAQKRGIDLTAQELQIARLALDGLTNPEIATRLFLSPRTVQYHLGNVFKKLGITSRTQLAKVLDDDVTLAASR
jgi:DNA-binding CsgD family transcriptional regulator